MDASQGQESGRTGTSWGELVGLGLLATVVVLLVNSMRSAPAENPIPLGTPLPTVMAGAWINSDGPISREALLGKVTVVDCWATWCPPCRAAMPALAKLHAAYHPLGVRFLGLTGEDASEKAKVARFVDSVDGFDWPVGVGAGPTLDMLAYEMMLPTVIVFSAEGGAIWSGHELNGIEAVLDQALAAAKAVDE